MPIEGAFVFTPSVHGDDRGSFHEWFKADLFKDAVGHTFDLAQANCSVSASGTIRGIHFAELPPSQAKYVSCVHGAILDVVVDIRLDSPTFGQWEAVRLDESHPKVVYLAEGLGHAFIALTDQTVVNYLCSAPYAPTREHGINPFDGELAIDWPTRDAAGREMQYQVSPKDDAAPTLAEVRASGLLPTMDEWHAFRKTLT
jgi:dTDP-4-dehydrorhamnose 3,5-epimerase